MNLPEPCRTQAAGHAPGAVQRFTVGSLQELSVLAAHLAAVLEPGRITLLHGGLGTGKTTLVREVCRVLGVPARRVVSPSFTLIQEYAGGRLPVVHIDLYRIDPGTSLDSLFLEEWLERADSVAFIEWPDAARPHLPAGSAEICIEFGESATERILTLTGFPPLPPLTVPPAP
ncbi:MAG: tRNA (adenosine(37)-N6)-threonylcarbamoyltransferase complex ATPase subunit type 1 TsaE [Candidatus Riflebacteria bacterium]|nr:tRNA (adenosine(37)-N6)-threonylcarbamoyltransferase complex ATPase subunit type 1 TsaE [Candidatus Riflebacteria bacterium]